MNLASLRRLQLAVLLGPATLFLIVFFAIPLAILGFLSLV